MTGKLADLRPAVAEFLDFAAASRPDWDRAELQGALTAAGNNRPGERSTGQHWAATVIVACRLLGDPEATPRDLLAEVRSPLGHERGAESPESRADARAAALAEGKRVAADANAARAAAEAVRLAEAGEDG